MAKLQDKAARRSVRERRYNETKDWVGGNFLVSAIRNNVTFSNNPLNYTHFEEQFVNNAKDKIIINYGIKFAKGYEEVRARNNELTIDRTFENVIVYTYSPAYGKRNVIMLGLYGQNLAKNPSLMNFFDNHVLSMPVCPKFQPCYLS